jgi:hypothetical protein
MTSGARRAGAPSTYAACPGRAPQRCSEYVKCTPPGIAQDRFAAMRRALEKLPMGYRFGFIILMLTTLFGAPARARKAADPVEFG